jgi:hypothetical protein
VIDPLQNTGASIPPGRRLVGVLVRVLNHGPAIYDSSATGDVSLATSSGGADASFVPHGVCQTPLRDFDNEISPGVARSGCVAFSVAAHAKVLAVRFSPHGGAAGRVSWLAR